MPNHSVVDDFYGFLEGAALYLERVYAFYLRVFFLFFPGLVKKGNDKAKPLFLNGSVYW